MSIPQRRVADDIVAAFRAYFSGSEGEWFARSSALDRSADGMRVYRAFLAAMFGESVRRRLGHQRPREAAIIEFVADVRARGDEIADLLDPEGTERLIAAAYGEPDGYGLGGEHTRIRLTVLTVIIRDAALSPAELDVFLERSRTAAEEVLGRCA